ncbi:MAG: hypothetical protein M3255_09960 [Pseudomonadota bacterium]|nr:hypothetical protein [Pseudomonadota bacterium]
MARVEIRVSDLTRQPIEDEEQAARLIVEHPDYPEPIGLDVLPDEVKPYLDEEATQFVVLSLEEPDNPHPDKRYAMALDDFNELFQTGDSETALNEAFAQQQEEQRQQRSRRKGAGRRGGRQRQQREPRQRRQERIDYTSPEYAGTPHRGTISEEEARYVRENLEAVNERLDREGHRTIDPTDPKMAADYRFPPPVGQDEVDERVEEREQEEERA